MSTQSHSQSCATPHKAPRRSIMSFLRQAAGLARQRRALRNLDPHLLKDIGLTPHDAENESTKPLWDVPRHWRL